MLNQALNREQQLQELEDAEKLARRNEVMELQQYLQQQKSDKAEYEKMIDQLVADENEKKWNERETQWQREDQARVNLLKNVYANRAADVELHKAQKDQALWHKDNERDRIQEEIARQTAAFEEKKLKDALMRKGHQTDILRQVGERDRQMRRDLQDKMYDERAAKLAELEYMRRINQEKANNDTIL